MRVGVLPISAPARFFMCDEPEQRLRVADLPKLAARQREVLLAEGYELHPVVNTSRKLAGHFWGAAWMRQLACCEESGLCLAPGRALLRHGCVLDVRIAPGLITAWVAGAEPCEVRLQLEPFDDEQTEQLALLCRGKIDSLMSLLEGKANDSLLQQLCDPEYGLLPQAEDWRISCTCPDWASPCPHAAAAMYAAGVLIDEDASLLFTLRSVDPATLIRLPEIPAAPMDADALSSMFGIKLDV